MTIITCSKCGAKNRVDQSRADHETPKCGKCGAPLPIDTGPLTVTDTNFAALVLNAGSTPIMVDCWATWCPPCRAIAPMVEQMAHEAAGRWRIGKLDVDANPSTARQFHLDSIPTLLIFKSGQLVDRLVGAHPKPAMEAALRKAAR
jgi:thioredoxin 2